MKWSFVSSSKSYRPLANKDDEDESIDLDDPSVKPSHRRRNVLVAVSLAILCATVTAIAFVSDYGYTKSKSTTSKQDEPPRPSDPEESLACKSRREWRTLTQPEKEHYISSVRCLNTLSSTLHNNSTLYEDFPWIHSHVGYATHHSASFLPWHRYFLHIYESTLHEQCNYTGALVYWDWTLDWEHLEKAPVFDTKTGFGGDGDSEGEITVGNTGRCLVDGPFTDITANFYDIKYQPHCLSRGFRTEQGELGHLDGKTISPDSIEEVLQLDNYESFVAEMESRVHDAIPFGIGGDFETFTAPYDPLFFLHHTQLDRLWYTWQKRKPEERLSAYSGRPQRHSMKMADLSDEMKMANLAVEIEVREVMDTEGGLLCYRY